MTDALLIKVTHPHRHVGDTPDYHEWTYVGPISCDRLGRPNPRITWPDWQFWRCNNMDCPGEAVVSNDFIRAALDGAE